MKPLEHLLRQLEAYVQEEIGAQARMLALLDAQEQAILAAEPRALLERTRAVEAELAHSAGRAQRRALLLDELAALWKLGRGALTLGSVVERCGSAAERLDRQRSELRAAAAKVTRKARRLGAAARTHQRLTCEALELLLAGGEPGSSPRSLSSAFPRSLREGGVLVDAEA